MDSDELLAQMKKRFGKITGQWIALYEDKDKMEAQDLFRRVLEKAYDERRPFCVIRLNSGYTRSIMIAKAPYFPGSPSISYAIVDGSHYVHHDALVNIGLVDPESEQDTIIHFFTDTKVSS